MNYEKMYREKQRTLDDVYAMLSDGDYIFCLTSSAEPRTFLTFLHRLKGVRKNLHIQATFTTIRFSEIYKDEYADLCDFSSPFFPRTRVPLQRSGRASYIPMHLRNRGVDTVYHLKQISRPMNYVIIAVTPMDKHGYFCSGSCALAMRTYLSYGCKVILEVNEACPRTFGDTYIHISEVDYIYNSHDNKINYYPSPPPTDEDKEIGGMIADLVHDGDTIQLGIGGILSGCANGLVNKRDLGVHTEMFNDGLMNLYNAGAITNKKKSLFKNKIVAAFSSGAKEVFDFVDDNPGMIHLDALYVNHPANFSKNDNIISVNTTLAIDLMGQCSSEAVLTEQISGTGGQTETIIGAKEAHGGRSVIALHSTRELKQPDGSKKRISTILPVHPAGTVISLARNDIDFVCTEYGMAALRGATLRERAQSLINIAHPDYRDELTEQAKRLWLI
ncbi:MAG: acetyl-CoA hydrolase/transferase family protein [Clostridia bacterium]|nr:acetyl-CoA hydrolase/transferase family protein [Clostridia bacterium]